MLLTLIENVEVAAQRIRLVLNWEQVATAPEVDLVLILRPADLDGDSAVEVVHFASRSACDGGVRHLGKKTAVVATDSAELSLAALARKNYQVIVGVMADGGPLADAPELRVRVVDADNERETVRVRVRPGAADSVFLAGELYRKGSNWYYRGLGFGFAEGLAAVAARYAAPLTDAVYQERAGGRNPAAPVRPEAAVPCGQTPSPAPAAGAGRGLVPLGNVQLLPGAQAIIPRPNDPVTATLTWKRRDKDLDLYALYVDRTGRSGVCYYRNQGSTKQSPYICLTTGVRSRGREVIEIVRPDQFRYILICAYSAVENGVGSFRSFRASAEVDDHNGSVIRSPLYHRNSFSYWVALALIDLSDEGSAAIQHVERYSRSGSEHRPVLRGDGSFVMDAGPVEFKSR